MDFLEKTVLKNLKAGDIKAFEFIFKGYFKPLYNYAKGLLHSSTKAEEVTSAIFTKLWEQRAELTIETSVKSYLFRSVYNNCMNQIKQMKVEDKYKAYFLYNHNEGYSSGADYPLERLIENELEKKIAAIISGLPGQCRTMFLLSREECLSNDEIASRLGVSVNTVRTQISRALHRFRKELRQYLPIVALMFYKVL